MAHSEELSVQELEELIEEATVDAYNEDEQRAGLFTMIQDLLELPFETAILGIQVRVIGVELNAWEELIAVCERNGQQQAIPLLDLPLPSPPPDGWKWIEAYRYWSRA
jgi:hypothetical protein